MEPFEVTAESTEAIEPRPSVVPFASKSAVECSLVFRLLTFPLRVFESFELAHLSGLTLGIPASASHVTRLTPDPSVLKGSERATEECLRALHLSRVFGRLQLGVAIVIIGSPRSSVVGMRSIVAVAEGLCEADEHHRRIANAPPNAHSAAIAIAIHA